MAGAERFELPTVGFGDRCSTNWNYAPAKWMPIILTSDAKTRAKQRPPKINLVVVAVIYLAL